MPSIADFEELKKECQGDKHVILEFFSPSCIYCKSFLPEFNRVYDHLLNTYGDSQLSIFKINTFE